MRQLLAVLACVLITCVGAAAQTPIMPLGIDSCTVVTSVETDEQILMKTGTKEVRVRWIYTVLRTPGGGTEYTIDASLPAFSGDVDLLAGMTAAEVYDVIASKTVSLAVAAGHASCSSAGNTSGVTLHSCVTRSSSAFAISGTNLNRRIYDYTCSAVSLASVNGTFGCGTGTEPTWVSGGGSLQ